MAGKRLRWSVFSEGGATLSGGEITEGRHDDLLESNAKYRNFIKLREEAAAWRLQS